MPLRAPSGLVAVMMLALNDRFRRVIFVGDYFLRRHAVDKAQAADYRTCS